LLSDNRKIPIWSKMATVSASANSAEPLDKEQGNRGDEMRFFNSDAPVIPAEMAELLEKYSGVPAGETQVEHVQKLRDRAYKEYQYPCLGLYRFLGLALSTHPLYDLHVLPLLRGAKDAAPAGTSWTLLDLGTCLGQDVRKLIFDGAPLDSVYGADLLAEFVNIGYDLFRDEEKLPRSHLIAPADIFDQSSRLKQFDGKADIIHANSVFHLFSWDDQMKAAKRVVQLMRPQKGSLILGSQIAHKDPGEVESRPGRRSSTMYRHDEKSWERFWETVGEEVGLSFRVKSSLMPYPKIRGMEDSHDGLSRMTFEVWRD
jgi:hypothetical protein